MSNKIIITSLLLALASTAAWADPTIADLSSLNAELKMQELQNKLEAAKTKGQDQGPSLGSLASGSAPGSANGASAPAPAPMLSAAAVESDDIKLQAIYGVGNDLKAEVLYNGNSFTLSKKDKNLRLGSWRVKDITPYRLILVKPAPHKKGSKYDTHREIYFSASSSSEGGAQSLNLMASPGTSSMPSAMPPVPMPAMNGQPYVSPLPPAPRMK